MHLEQATKYHRFPVSVISHAVCRYHRFNDSSRDIAEELAYRGITVNHETIRSWCIKFATHFKDVIRKRERKPKDIANTDRLLTRTFKSLLFSCFLLILQITVHL